MPGKSENQRSQGERLRKARLQAGFRSASEAAARYHWKASTYLAHENGQNGIKPDVAIEYGKAFGVDPGYLLTGAPNPVDKSQVAVIPETIANTSHGKVLPLTADDRPPRQEREIDLSQMPRDFPMLGVARCGEDGLFEFNGQTVDYVRRPPRLKGIANAYGLYVSGDSMFPWRKDGGIVYVHPGLPVLVNDFVVVQLKPAKPGMPPAAYIKQLVRRTSTELHLFQFNPRKEIVIKAARVGSIHRVLDWDELMAL